MAAKAPVIRDGVFVDLDGIVRTVNDLGVALQLYQEFLNAEHTPVRHHITETLFVLDLVKDSRRRISYRRCRTFLECDDSAEPSSVPY
jgi:hypothetical protein